MYEHQFSGSQALQETEHHFSYSSLLPYEEFHINNSRKYYKSLQSTHCIIANPIIISYLSDKIVGHETNGKYDR